MLVISRLLPWLCAPCCTLLLAQTPELLHAPVHIERRIELKRSQPFLFHLGAGAYFQAIANTSSTTLELKLFDSDNRQMAVASVRALTIVPAAGQYRLEVNCASNALAGGWYGLDVYVNQKPAAAERRLVHATELRLRGVSEKQHGREAAQKSFDEALTIYQSLGDTLGERETWRSMATLARDSGDYSMAAAYFEREIASARADGDRVSESRAFFLWGGMYTERDRQQALKLFEQSLAAARQLDNDAWRALVLNATAAMEMPAQIERALTLLKEAQGNAARAGSALLRGDVLLAEGNAFTYREDFRRSLHCYEQALSLYREAGYAFGIANALDNEGNSFTEIGDWEGALKALDESISLWGKEGNRIQQGFALHNRARVFAAQGDMARARGEFIALNTRFQELGATEAEGVNYTELGGTYVASGQPQEALECFRKALEALNKAGTLQERGRALLLRSRAKRSLGRNDDAIADAEQALGFFRKLSDRNSELLGYEARARAEFAGGRKDEAAKSMTQAVNLMETGRAELKRPALQTAYFVTRASFTEFYIEVLIACGRMEDAFLAAERFRGRSFIDSLDENGRRAILTAADPQWAAEEATLRQKLREESASLAALQPSEQAPVKRRVDDLLEQLDRLAENTRANPSRAVSLVLDEPLRIGVVQRMLLEHKCVLVEFFLAEPRSWAWILNGSSLRVVELSGRNEIESAAGHLRSTIAAFEEAASQDSALRLRERRTAAGEEITEAAANLNALTLAKFSSLLRNQRLAIAPDGALWYTPWSMLAGHGSAEIVVVPSATAVLRIEAARQPPAAKQLAVFADPVYERTDARVAGKDWQSGSRELPVTLRAAADNAGMAEFGRLRFSREEALAISHYVSREQLLLMLDFDASRQSAASAGLEQYRVVHFATHTLVNNQHPELSGIVLSLLDRKGQAQDGFFRLFDIYHLRLKADLVTLSGCRTALGKELRGEGLVGLTQGFLSAGADQVLASLWPVEDQATAEFMTRFYADLLKKRMPPSKALRAAQESMRADPAWRAPYYWAAFQLVGDWR